MRLKLFLAPMFFFMIHSVAFAEYEGLLCPGSDADSVDEAHVKFEVQGDMDHQEMVGIAAQIINNSTDPNLKELEPRQNLYYAYKDLPILIRESGYKTFQFPEKKFEYVVLRPIEECLVTQELESAERYYVYTRAFDKEEINIAVIHEIMRRGGEVDALSPRGQSWICAANSEAPNCKLLHAP